MKWLCKIGLHRWLITREYATTCELACARCPYLAIAANDPSVGIVKIWRKDTPS